MYVYNIEQKFRYTRNGHIITSRLCSVRIMQSRLAICVDNELIMFMFQAFYIRM